MRLTWITSGILRRSVLAGLALAITFVLGAATSSFAQAAPAQQQQQAPAKPDLAFTNDAGLIYFFVKPEKTAEFEDLMTKFKDALAKSEAPEAKQQAAGMTLFKVPAPTPTMVTYVLIANPTVKDVEYWFLSVLYKAYPNDAQAIYQKWQDMKVSPFQQIVNLTQVMKFQ